MVETLNVTGLVNGNVIDVSCLGRSGNHYCSLDMNLCLSFDDINRVKISHVIV